MPVIAIFFGIVVRMYYKGMSRAISTPSIKRSMASSTSTAIKSSEILRRGTRWT